MDGLHWSKQAILQIIIRNEENEQRGKKKLIEKHFNKNGILSAFALFFFGIREYLKHGIDFCEHN